ncbi:hypothetical protein C8R46DRAFT_1357185 [Mycena filopes]|nr:hypothetical protein C8R46DRAFT_1357185 [Mycena filopes]
MKFTVSVPSLLVILLPVLVEALPISNAAMAARVPTNADAALAKRQIFFKHYADVQAGEDEAENLTKRQIFFKHYADPEQEENASETISKRQIFFKHYEQDTDEDRDEDDNA